MGTPHPAGMLVGFCFLPALQAPSKGHFLGPVLQGWEAQPGSCLC